MYRDLLRQYQQSRVLARELPAITLIHGGVGFQSLRSKNRLQARYVLFVGVEQIRVVQPLQHIERPLEGIVLAIHPLLLCDPAASLPLSIVCCPVSYGDRPLSE